MGFLKKFGVIVGGVLQTVAGVSSLFPKSGIPIIDTFAQISRIIMTAEVFGQALNIPGHDKLKGVTPLVAQLILQSDMIAGKKIDNPVLFKKGAEQVAAGVADILNSMKEDAIKAESII